MNAKEISEIRRRYRADRTNIGHVWGCFVNGQKEILSEFDQSLGMMNEEDATQVLSVLKRALSGTVGRNLIDLDFTTEQVLSSEEHAFLMRLRESELRDAALRAELYEKIISSLEIEGNFLILCAAERCDVFRHGADGEQMEESEQTYSYILCAICPIKEGKPTLSYYLPGNCFRSLCADTVLTRPSIGFLFPRFEERGTNIYGALYYTRDLTDSHEELADALFGTPMPMPAVAQKETFGALLEQTMEKDCSLSMVRSVHGQICQMIEEHKAEKIDEPLVLTESDACDMLRFCGMEEDKVEAFAEKFKESFGEDASLTPRNIADQKQMKIEAPDVQVKIAPGCGNLVETRVIDGVKYIVIRAEGEVTVNGVKIHI